VHGITEENLNFLIAQALGKVQTETQAEKEILTEIEDRMKQLKIRATGE
jgi:hypothetical protein